MNHSHPALRNKFSHLVLPGLLCLLALPADARGPLRIKHERGVVYGKLEGIGLTMDVFTPLKGGNGKGLICVVSGSFFSSREILDQFSWVFESASRNYGYTIFAVMHAGLPRFSIGQIVPQITRSVRYVRAHAGQYGVDPERLGMMGFSSGGYLSLMTGVRGDDGVTTSTDPVERTSSRVQAVVAFFPPTDFLHYGGQAGPALNLGLTDWFRSIVLGVVPPQTNEKELGRALSPRYDVTRSAAPTLLIHGDLDPIVPLQQSEVFLEAMRAAGAPCQLRIKRGAGHGWADMGPDLHAAMEWFGRYLNGPPARG